MAVRVDVAPSLVEWALSVTSANVDRVADRYDVDLWMRQQKAPTLKQLESFAETTGVPFGYLLLPEPPAWELPVPDFREGFGGSPTPSADLMAVIGQSQHRQEWYREYALGLGAEPLGFVGSAAGMDTAQAAATIRATLGYEVHERRGSWSDARKTLLRAFEGIGGLTVVTSMVGHNTQRPLDEHEFRGFTLVDDIAPLVFVNAHQTLNGQIFTLAHEFAHVWRGASGVGNEEPSSVGRSSIERWCNEVASEVLVPADVLAERHRAVSQLPITDSLVTLSRNFRCGTLVVLQALNRTGIRRFDDFQAVYDDEVARLGQIMASQRRDGGDFYNNLPFRVGDRLSRALIADVEEGRTAVEEAMRLMSVRSLSVFDKYARELGVA